MVGCLLISRTSTPSRFSRATSIHCHILWQYCADAVLRRRGKSCVPSSPLRLCLLPSSEAHGAAATPTQQPHTLTTSVLRRQYLCWGDATRRRSCGCFALSPIQSVRNHACTPPKCAASTHYPASRNDNPASLHPRYRESTTTTHHLRTWQSSTPWLSS